MLNPSALYSTRHLFQTSTLGSRHSHKSSTHHCWQAHWSNTPSSAEKLQNSTHGPFFTLLCQQPLIELSSTMFLSVSSWIPQGILISIWSDLYPATNYPDGGCGHKTSQMFQQSSCLLARISCAWLIQTQTLILRLSLMSKSYWMFK